MSSELAGKRLEILKETIPNLARVILVWNPRDRASAQEWKQSELASRQLGLQLQSMEIGSADEIDTAFKDAARFGSGALAVASSPLFTPNQKRIVDLATKYRLPAIYPRGDYVASGGLLSYGADQVEPYTRAAVMVDKILKGTKSGEIPVEQPKKFELLINLKTAKQIGLAIPARVLERANQVIK
jgi:putative ABC transport system substrate-binding protein